MLTPLRAALSAASLLGLAAPAFAQPNNQTVGFVATFGGQVSSVLSFNSAGGTNAVSITGTGQFQVTLPGLGNGLISNVQVNAFNTNGHPHICTSEGWGSSNGTDVVAYVGCFDFSGNPYPGDFSLFYQSRAGAPGGALGFIWADQPTSPSYTPNTNWNYNNFGVYNTVTRSGTGSYLVTFPSLAGGGNPQVTAYSFSATAARCEISGWTQHGSTTQVGVLCFDGSGNPADEYFSLAYNRSTLEDEGAANGAFGFAYSPKRATPYTPRDYYSEYGGLYPTSQRFGIPYQGQYSFSISNPTGRTISPLIGMVTAVGTAGEYCEVEGYDTYTTSFDMNLVCYAANGLQANATYNGTMLYQVH